MSRAAAAEVSQSWPEPGENLAGTADIEPSSGMGKPIVLPR